MTSSGSPKMCYRVVVVSPGDVRGERELVEPAVAEVNRTLALAGRQAFLEVWRWETDVYPGFHPEGPQGRIDEDLDIENCQIVVGIFWSRFGSPVMGVRSGTEHEIRKALNARQRSRYPEVMLYFCDREYTPSTPEESEQRTKVLSFRNEMSPLSLYYTFGAPADFERLLRGHLMMYSFRVLKDTGAPPPADESGFHLQVSASVPSVRAEGLSEALGQISLVPRGKASDPTAVPSSVDVKVFIDVTLTNRRLAGDFCDAFLVSRPPGGPSSVHLGRIMGVNYALFKDVPLRGDSDSYPGALEILNLRGNASMKGLGSGVGEVLVHVEVNGVPVVDPQQPIAKIGKGLHFEVVSADGASMLDSKTGTPLLQSRSERRRVATLRYREGMPAAFKYKAQDLRTMNRAAPDRRFFESACLGVPVRTNEGNYSLVGLADSGTILTAVFNNVPSGLRLLVSVNETHATSGLQARLVQNGPGLPWNMSYSEESVNGTSVVPVELGRDQTDLGVGLVAWEIRSRDEQAPGLVEFGVFVDYSGRPEVNLPGLGTVSVNGFLAPSSTETGVSKSGHVPRFVDTSIAKSLFTIIRL